MIEDRQEELASLYVFDLLEGAVRDQFESALASDGELQSLVRDLKETSCRLAFTAPAMAAPAALKQRVLDSVEETSADAARNVIRPAATVWNVIPWAVAACFTLVSIWLGQRYASTRAEMAASRNREELAEIALQSTQQQLEAERILNQRRSQDAEQQLANLSRELGTARDVVTERERVLADTRQRVALLTDELKSQGDLANLKITALASMLQNIPQAQAIAVWDPKKQEGILDVQKLPALAANEDYQIWVVDPQYPIPVDGGVFTVEPSSGSNRVKFTAKQPVRVINAFAVTRERKGGVPKAEGPFVLMGK